MKKRIISLILVVVMLALSLVGCGYSFAKDDDIMQHIKGFDKTKFDAALKSLKIDDKDLDFTADQATRLQKIEDQINSALATASKDVSKKTEGVMGENDVLYYCYYVTFRDKDGKTVFVAPEYIRTTKALSVQNGGNFLSKLEKEIINKANGFDFKDKTYSNQTSGRIEAGAEAFISYSYSYDTVVEKDGKLVVQTVSDKVSLQLVTLDASDPIHKQLVSVKVDKTDKDGKPVVDKDGNVEQTLEGLLVGSTAADIKLDEYVINGKTIKPETLKKVPVEGSEEQVEERVPAQITISKAKIEFVMEGDKFAEIKDTTYTEKKEVKDIYQSQHDLKNVELTYHVYVTSYLPVIDLTAENVIELVYGNTLSVNILAQILFGYDVLDEEITTEEEREQIFKTFESKFDLDAVSKELDAAIAALNAAKKQVSDAESALAAAEKKLADYEATLPSGDKRTEEQKDQLKSYEDAVEKCEQALYDAKLAKAYAQEKVTDKYNVIFASDRTNDILTFEQFANIVVQALKSYNTAKSGVTSAESTLDKSETAYVNAVDAYNKAVDKVAACKKAVNDAKDEAEKTKAETDLKAAEDAKSKAETEMKSAAEKVESDKDALIKAEATLKYATEKRDIEVDKLLNFKKDIKETIVSGYEQYLYESKQASYRSTLKDKLAEAVYEAIKANFKVDTCPEDAIEMVYEQLIDEYQYTFYNGTFESDEKDENGNKIKKSYYTEYNGNFKQFLINTVVSEFKISATAAAALTYKDACAYVRQKAIDTVKPIVQVYAAAQAYGQTLTEKEYKQLLKEDVEEYNKFMAMIGYADLTEDQYVETFGEVNLRAAYQFDKLMNYFLASKEVTDSKSPLYKNDVYTLVKFEITEKN